MSIPAPLAARLRLPVICAPLFIISGPDLVIAQCKAGVVGSFPSLNARTTTQLDEWLHRIREELAAWDRDHPASLSAPFAVNQIVHRTNNRLEQDLELCSRHRVPLVITSLGAREDVNETVHGWGGLVMHDVIDDRFGRKAVEKGADGLIAVAAGAGGHAGTLSPFALVQELRAWFDGPLALSGAIANGRAVLAAQALGADFAYIGSMFIASEEANAVAGYKQMLVDGAAKDIVYSNLFTGVHGNYLRPSIVAAGLDPDKLPQSDPSRMSFGSGGSSKAKAWRDIWGCGQGIGSVDAVRPAVEHVARLAREYTEACNKLPGAPGPTAEVISGGRRRAHDEIRARAARAATGLSTFGLGEGDTVALLLRNDFAFFEASLAVGQLGAYPVPLNWHSTADEVGYVLTDCEAKVLVVHADLLPRIASSVPAGVQVLVVKTPPEILAAYGADAPASLSAGALAWDVWADDFPADAAGPQAERAAVIYTSGTTGRPKGVQRRPTAPDALAPMIAAGYGLAPGRPITVLMNGPMYHSAPNAYALAAFGLNARIVLEPRFDAEELLALIARERVTHMHIVPTMFVRLLALPAEVRLRYDLSSLRFVVHGAAPCPPEIKRAMIAWWGPIIHEYYGATEAGLITGLDAQQALERPGSVGRPLPGVTLSIQDEAGSELGPGEIGDVYIKSKQMPGFTYIGADQKRADMTRADYITLGDIGYRDADGFLYLCDRRKDMIISGGVNIYPAEVEAALLAIKGVQDCAVFGVPDAEFGQSVCAYVQPQAGVSLERVSIREQLRLVLSGYKVPRRIELVDDLPREDSGKVFKRKFRDRLNGGLEANLNIEETGTIRTVKSIKR